MNKNFQLLSESEMEVMKIIWANNDSVLFSKLLSELESKQIKWKPNTILTFLSRLSKKGVITIQKNGRLNNYIALISENCYLEQQTKYFLENVYGGDTKSLISTLIKSDNISYEDFEELKSFWNRDGESGK